MAAATWISSGVVILMFGFSDSQIFTASPESSTAWASSKTSLSYSSTLAYALRSIETGNACGVCTVQYFVRSTVLETVMPFSTIFMVSGGRSPPPIPDVPTL